MEETLQILRECYQAHLSRTFPYAELRKLRDLTGIPSGDLNPDIDSFCSNVAGYASSPQRLLTMPPAKASEAEQALSQSLTETYPHMTALVSWLETEHFPEVSSLLHHTERCRHLLLDLLRSAR